MVCEKLFLCSSCDQPVRPRQHALQCETCDNWQHGLCNTGEKKLGKVITPDPWKTGARNTTEGGGRKVGENKALTAKKNRFAPYEGFEKCKICKSVVHQKGSHYCQGCAYKKGICAMCGKKIIETKNYRQTSV